MQRLLTNSSIVLMLSLLIVPPVTGAGAVRVRDHREPQPAVRDHRESQPHVRDHREKRPTVRDHREKRPVVRDHREKRPAVRDHREPRPAKTPVHPARTRIRYIRAVNVSETTMRVMVGYDYRGRQGTSDVYMNASALQADGTTVPGLVDDVTEAEVRRGRGRTANTLELTYASGTFMSTRVEVCITHRFRGDVVCRTVPHRKVWTAEAEPAPYPTEAPPPPKAGNPGTRRGYVWVSGHWEWQAGTWEWKRGHWERAKSGYRWQPGSWQRRGARYVWGPGHWVRR
jgi:hypothetical protein